MQTRLEFQAGPPAVALRGAPGFGGGRGPLGCLMEEGGLGGTQGKN